jgi:hypothetical protein
MYIDISMIIEKNVFLKVLTNISHVLDIVKNLFFVSKIISHDHIFEFKNKICIMRNMHKEVVGQGMWENQFYKL